MGHAMTLLFVLGVALLTVPLFGGRLRHLAEIRFRAAWLALAAIAVQILIISVVPGGPPALYRGVHLASYVLVGAFVIANRTIPGLPLIGLGGALNLVAIVANGGVMPASPPALDAAGVRPDAGEFENSVAVTDARLGWLGDVFATPGFLPVDNVYSVGDLIIAVGVLVVLHRVCGSRLRRPGGRRPAPQNG
jgi:hypothetical protein